MRVVLHSSEFQAVNFVLTFPATGGRMKKARIFIPLHSQMKTGPLPPKRELFLPECPGHLGLQGAAASLPRGREVEIHPGGQEHQQEF
jgi:hypothetical protein